MRELLGAGLVMALVAARPASASEKTVGGHIGVALPLAAVSASGTSTIADGVAVAVPVGVGFPVSPRVVFDMEVVSVVGFEEETSVGLVIHPGMVFKVADSVGAGVRAAFELLSNAVGFSPLVNKGFAMGEQVFFVEGVVPVRWSNDAEGDLSPSAGLAVHFGVGF